MATRHDELLMVDPGGSILGRCPAGAFEPRGRGAPTRSGVEAAPGCRIVAVALPAEARRLGLGELRQQYVVRLDGEPRLQRVGDTPPPAARRRR